MKKNLLIIALAILTFVACRGRSDRLHYVEEEVEYRPLVTDSAAIDSINSAGLADVNDSMIYPDIPEEGKINMKANDNEIADIIDGTGDGDMTKEEGNY